MKTIIKKFLKWIGAIYEPPIKKEQIEAWPFPVEFKSEKKQVKRKPTLKKATTRTVAKKATTVAKKVTKKKAK